MFLAACGPDDHDELGTEGGRRVKVSEVEQDEVVQAQVERNVF